MTEYIDLDTGEKLRDREHANQAYRAGHRIRVDSDGVPVAEWIPGSNDFYSYEGGKKTLHRWEREKRNWMLNRIPLRELGAGDS